MNVARKRTLPGDKDGPGQKRLAHTSKQDGQAQESATKEDACIPQQVLPPLSLSEEMEVQKHLDACTKSIWSGTLKFHTRPQSQSNDQKQAMVISGCRVRSYESSYEKINTVNWPKQLKMTTISYDDSMKLRVLRVMRATHIVTFSMDEDCDKMSHRAFFQSTSWPNYRGFALLEYTSSGIWLFSIVSCSLGGENVTVGNVLKFTYQDRVVKLLSDHGIISHSTTANMLAKENASLKEELQQKDKELGEQEFLNQEKMKNQILIVREKLTRMEVEKEALMKDKEEQYEELKKKDTAWEELKERLKNEKEKNLAKRLAIQKSATKSVKKITSLQDELQQKDKTLVEQQILHQEEMESKNEIVEEKSEQLTRMEVEREALMKDKEEQYEELKKKNTALEELNERLKNEKEKMLVEQQQLMKNMRQKGMEEKTKIMAEAWRNLTKIREDMEAVKNKEKEKLVNRLNELVENVEVKQAVLDDIEQTIEKDLKCSICRQLFIKTTTLNCSHSFCADCINKWREENDTCPICREDIQTSVQCLIIDNFIETVRERKETISSERGEQANAMLDEESDDQSSTVTSPSYSTAYHPSPAHSLSSIWSRSPSSIANIYSPAYVASTSSFSPA